MSEGNLENTLSCGCKSWMPSTDEVRAGAYNDEEAIIPLTVSVSPDCVVGHTNDTLREYIEEGLRDGLEQMVFDGGYGDCPICLGWIPSDENRGEYAGATSRFNAARLPTLMVSPEICSACGTAEAIMDLSLCVFEDIKLRDAIYNDWELWRAGVLIQRDILGGGSK